MSNRKKVTAPEAVVSAPVEAIAGHDDPVATIVAELAVSTLTGDLRDFILDRLRYEQDKRPWHERSESEQREAVRRVESAVETVVRRAVELIAAQGRKTIKATLAQITVKDGIKAILEMSKFDPLRHAFCDAQGSTVLIVVADPADFTGEREPVEITPDQATLAMVEHSAPDGRDSVDTASPLH